jgi:hypothetical protein
MVSEPPTPEEARGVPGAVLRIGVPDTGQLHPVLCRGRKEIDRDRSSRSPTPLIATQETCYWYGHRTMHYLGTLAVTCRAVRFTNDIEQ